MIIAFMMSAPIRTVLTALLLFPSFVWAFNAPAHRVVGHVAAARLCPQTAAAIAALDPDRSLAEAGVWADEIRGEDYWDGLKPWHYLNIPDGVPLAEAPRSRRGDVLLGIEKFAADLADESVEELDRKVAYRLVVHFVADIHQPLHVGRYEDRGGNKIRVRVDGRRTSLHAYWDGFDLARVVEDPRDYARYLEALFAARQPAPGGAPADWARESIELRGMAYAVPPGEVPELTQAYRERYMQIINLRLYEAGVRLAAVLDGIFCTAK